MLSKPSFRGILIMGKELNIEIKECIDILIKGKFIILCLTILITVAISAIGYYGIRPIYGTKISIIAVKSGLEKNNEMTYEYTLLAENLIKTYMEIAKSNTVAEKASQKLNGEITSDEIIKSIVVSIDDNAPIMTISAKGKNKENVFKIVNAVSDAFMEQSVKIYTTDNIQIMDNAIEPQNPIVRSLNKMLLLGFLAGLIISILVVFFKDYMDTSIKSEEDVKKYLNLNVIGTIAKGK